MARIGHWQGQMIGVYFTAEEQAYLGSMYAQHLGILFDNGTIMIGWGNGAVTWKARIDDGRGVDSRIWFLGVAGLAHWPRWQTMDVGDAETAGEHVLTYKLPDPWALEWPKYNGKNDRVRAAAEDFCKKCILTGRDGTAHKLVPAQAINFARKGLAKEYLERIDEFLPTKDTRK